MKPRRASALGAVATSATLFVAHEVAPLACLVALAPLSLAVRGVGPSRSLALGGLSHGAAFLLVTRFAPGTLVRHGLTSWPLALALWGVAAALASAPTALFAWRMAARSPHPARQLITAALLLAAAEAIASRVVPAPLGAPLVDVYPLASSAAWLGPAGPSLVAALVGGAVALAWELARSARTLAPVGLGALGASLAGPALAGAPHADVVRVALVQTGERAWERRALPHALLAQAWEAGAALVVLPEAALEVVGTAEEARALGRLLASERAGAVVVGVIAEGPPRRNTVWALSSEGLVGHHDKARLLPIAERLPWEPLRGWFPHAGRFEAGAVRAPTEVPGVGLVAMLICSEDASPHALADSVALSAEPPRLLVSVASDAWMDGTRGAALHARLAAMRAVETGAPLVRVSATGLTLVVGADGRVQAALPEQAPGLLLWDVALAPARVRSPYQAWGDGPLWLAALLALAAQPLRAFLKRFASANMSTLVNT
jgi:apolipoprotein N-acyltransferase